MKSVLDTMKYVCVCVYVKKKKKSENGEGDFFFVALISFVMLLVGAECWLTTAVRKEFLKWLECREWRWQKLENEMMAHLVENTK